MDLQPDVLILTILWFAGALVGAFSFIHALLQRSTAFTAADRLTKPIWLAITGAALLGLIVIRPYDFALVVWTIPLIAALVYIVDVRPKLAEIQRGHR